jgi:hypothetical protein
MYQGKIATTTIPQTNVAQGGGRGKWIAIVAIVGAAAAAAVVVRNNRNGDESTSSTPPIAFGGSAVGAPSR